MRKKAYVLSSILLSSLISSGQRLHSIDSTFNKCTAAYQNNPAYGGEPAPSRHCDAQALKAWHVELARLMAKVPDQHAIQDDWIRQRDQHIAQMKNKYNLTGIGLSTTGRDEIRWYEIDLTRKRVLQLTKLAKEQPFTLPKE